MVEFLEFCNVVYFVMVIDLKVIFFVVIKNFVLCLGFVEVGVE